MLTFAGISLFVSSCNIFPGSSNYYYNLGAEHYNKKKYSDAFKLLQKAAGRGHEYDRVLLETYHHRKRPISN
jgi:hypothetical protein